MAETASSVTVNDIPEELKGYRKALLNAAFGQVFNPEYLKGQIPEANFWAPTVPVQPTQPTQPTQGTGQAIVNPNSDNSISRLITQIAGMGEIGDSANSVEEMLSNRVQYAGGGLAAAADAVLKMYLNGGDVVLGASGTPLGGYTAPMVVSPTPNIPHVIRTGTQQPPSPVPPSVTTPATSTPNGVIGTPPTATLPVGNPNPQQPNPQPQPQPTTSIPQPTRNPNAPSYAPAMFTANKPNNFAGAEQARQGGYNPAQYADDSVAQDLARQLGGNVVYTNTVGPISPPSQAMIDAGGSNMHNAGLIADINRRFADDEGMRNYALENLRKEIRSYGGDTGNFSRGGVVRMAAGGAVDNQLLGVGSSQIPSNTPAGYQQGAFNDYQAYGGQRILGMGNQGQVDSSGNLQSSDLTRNSLAGYASMPSYFNSSGGIEEGRDSNGNATTPLGIAGDTFNSAGRLALDASTRAGDASYTNSLNSTFGSALGRIAEDPTMFQAGDISLGELTAPQMEQPTGVGTSSLTSYQMAGPRLIDTSGSNINPYYINSSPSLNNYQANGGNNVQSGSVAHSNFTDPGMAQAYMSPYIQSVVDVQRDRANQDFRESKANRSAAAIKAGAFGGNRQAVADSLAERDRAQLLNQIQANGSQAAFENAQQQFERDRGASLGAQQFNVGSKLQADLANQGAGQGLTLANLQALLSTQQLGATLGQQANMANQSAYMDAASKNQGTNLQSQLANQQALQGANQANLNAALGVQELGANQYMQSQLANQNAGLAAGQANLNAALNTQNLARTSGLSAAQANQQTRLSQNTTLLDAMAKADQLQQQAAQGNFSNQMNALGQQTNSALAANTIGQSRADLGRLAQAQELLRLQSMGQAGSQVDTRTQNALDLGYQDWTNARNSPYNQINWLQSILSGTPMGYNQENVQFQRTNPLSQIAGLGTAALGAYQTGRSQ